MPDPLSIATGVLALLQVTGFVASELKKFHDGSSLANKTLSDLHRDLESLNRVLESMRNAFEHITAEQSGTTGHVGALWDNVARSIQDSKDVMRELQNLLIEINKDASFLDEHRKQLRLKRAEERITRFRLHIHSYRDGLQLSMQTIILVNQMSYSKSAEDKVLPSLSQLQDDVRRIAVGLNQRIVGLRGTPGTPQDDVQQQVAAMSNLRDCVRSAASTISSATTVMTARRLDDDAKSDLADYFPAEQSLAMQRWMESQTVCEYGEDSAVHYPPPQSVADVPVFEGDGDADSDDELQDEIVRLLYESGMAKLRAGDTSGAERSLRNCLNRLRQAGIGRPGSALGQQSETLRLVVTRLCDIFHSQQRWIECQDVLSQKLALIERLSGTKDLEYFRDSILLANVMKELDDTAAAQLHARRALKGCRKLQDTVGVDASLVLLIDLCEADGNENDRDAYATMLETLVVYESSPAHAGQMPEQHGASLADAPSSIGPTEAAAAAVSKLNLQSTAAEGRRGQFGDRSKTTGLHMVTQQRTQDQRQARTTAELVGPTAEPVPEAPVFTAKIVLIGDSGVGKTCLLKRFCQGVFLDEYTPTTFDNHVDNVELDGKYMHVALRDTAGAQGSYDDLRRASYRDAHVVLICFAINDPYSLMNVERKWYRETMELCPKTPTLLVGLQLDQPITTLDMVQKRLVAQKESVAVGRTIGARKYFECSAKTGEGVRDLFEYATRTAVAYGTKPSKKKEKGSLRRLFGSRG
ncbi:uncharacterized protein LTR77_010450 [Saxophila tyrrhenica]|uniref:Azaphilone pigments biosynthesis cluster protein L N-terminal domain-containing protein n=1 Tax=Saxophila tyrrhenica TaxID=1690608 RepID=A0AAV9NVZ6_9PEZI|nr:hypothetical protein LTR77_010450 [Saxophila tyrrhenica]